MAEIEDEGPAPARRSDDLLGRKDSKLRKELLKVWDQVRKGFEDQGPRADEIIDYQNAYNCILDENQYYNGDAEIYISIIKDAVDARATRFVNQLFPQGGSYVESVSNDGNVNGPIVDLLQEYIELAKLKTEIVKPLCRTGDIEGQYNLYVDWTEARRQIVSRDTHPPEADGIPIPGEEDIEDVSVEDIAEGRPVAEVLHDTDVLVLPADSDSVEEALQAGGLVAIVRRWSKAKLKRLADAGIIRKDAAKELEEMMAGSSGKGAGVPPDAEKLLAELAGIRKKGSEATVWEVWKKLPLNDRGSYSEDGTPRLCRIFLGPDLLALGAARNPHWNDRCPLISAPVEKTPGVFKGRSKLYPVISLQWAANDAANRGEDVDNLTALPIMLRDPASGNEPLIANVGAIWDVPPNSLKVLEWPDMNPRAIAKIQYCISQIFQSLGVNPSMLPQQTSQSRRNQAQIAQEQAVDLLTTAEAVSVLEECILTPLVGWWVDLDYQHRDRDLTVKTHGVLGVRANMQPIPPFKTRSYYRFKWWGADNARYNAVHYQQEIAWINVAKALAPDLAAEGKRINFTPILEGSAAAIFGPRYRGLVIEDLRAQMSIDAATENGILAQGDDVPTSIFDDDAKHIQIHQQGMQQGDLSGAFRVHIQRHIMQAQAKQKAAMMAQMQQQIMPQGGQQPRPSRGGQGPMPGGQPGGSRPLRGPPGAVHPDAMIGGGGIMMPRKM